MPQATAPHPTRTHTAVPALLPGVVLTAFGVLAASTIADSFGSVPLIVASVLVGALIANTGMVEAQVTPGLAFASKTLLRSGIVLLGLRLSLGDVAGLGVSAVLVIVATVTITFFAVQFAGRKLGLSPELSLLVASGFSICGNSAIASVKEAAPAKDEEVAAAIGLVTLCGTAAIFVVPALGALAGLDDMQLGVWAGAGVQDTAQVIAVASAAGPAVLAIATAVKLTRVLFLAPIVTGVSMWTRRDAQGDRDVARPAVLPLFVLGFLVALLVRTAAVLPGDALDHARVVEQHLLAAGMVGLGSSIQLARLRNLGIKPLALGAIAWLIVGSVSLGLVYALGV